MPIRRPAGAPPFWACLLAGVVACGDPAPSTDLLVVVNSDLRVGAELSRLEVQVYDRDRFTGEPLRLQEFAVAELDAGEAQQEGRFPLPLTFSIAPDTPGSRRDLRVVITGFGPLGAGGEDIAVAEAQAITSFRPQRSQRLPMFLARRCLRELCRDDEGERTDNVCDVDTGLCGPVVAVDPVCQEPWSDAGGPEPVRTTCDGECVDTLGDRQHCGACDSRCENDQLCLAGVCRPDCGEDQTLCTDRCFDLQTDSDHCGDCDTACENGQTCRDGKCGDACTTGRDMCDDMCVDLDSDDNYCGDCQTRCQGRDSCRAGGCVDLVAAYLDGLPEWPTFAQVAEASDGPVPNAESEQVPYMDGFDLYTCTRTPYRLTQPLLATWQADPDLWLGALLQGQNHHDGAAALSPLTFDGRAPIRIRLEGLSETRVVADPTEATVQAALDALVRSAAAGGRQFGDQISYTWAETHGLDQALLELELSSHVLSPEARQAFDTEPALDENTLTALFVQTAYTATAEPPDAQSDVYRAQDLFADTFTEADMLALEAAGDIGQDNPPLYVGSARYGRALLVSLRSRHTLDQLSDALAAVAAGALDGAALDLLGVAEIHTASLGDETASLDDDEVDAAVALVREGRLDEYFIEQTPLMQARRLSYVLKSVVSNDVADLNASAGYTRTVCAPAGQAGAVYDVRLDRLEVVSAQDCDRFPDETNPELYYSFQLRVGDDPPMAFASRSAGNAVNVGTGGSLGINATRQVTLYQDTGGFRITGTAHDRDGTSGDDLLGTWDLGYGYPTTNGSRYFTRNNGACRVRLHLTITEGATL